MEWEYSMKKIYLSFVVLVLLMGIFTLFVPCDGICQGQIPEPAFKGIAKVDGVPTAGVSIQLQIGALHYNAVSVTEGYYAIGINRDTGPFCLDGEFMDGQTRKYDKYQGNKPSKGTIEVDLYLITDNAGFCDQW